MCEFDLFINIFDVLINTLTNGSSSKETTKRVATIAMDGNRRLT